jgi:hypothetical protein
MSSGRAFCFSGHRGVVNPNHDITMNTQEISHRQKSRGTFHLPDFTKGRLRRNLRTTDVQQAMPLRDRILMGNPANLAP